MKDNIQEAGADVKESGLFSGAGYLDDRGFMSQNLSPVKMGNSCLKAHLHVPVEAKVFIMRERGTEQRSREGVETFSRRSANLLE